MTDRRRRAASSDSTSREDNPFAPPPEGQPDQPWEPRRASGNGESGTGPGQGSGQGSGSDADSGSSSGSGSGSDGDGEGKPSRWGSQWSSRQPGRQSGGFGGGARNGGPGNANGGSGDNNKGNGGPGGQRGMRWDPTDPLQRHARYALHAGIWGLFFALLSIPQVALLLGALALYWGINALRGKPQSASASSSASASRTGGRRLKGRSTRATAEDVAGTDRSREDEQDDTSEPERKPQIPLAVTPAQAAKAKKTAAISGLVTSGLTLALVAATFTFQSVYDDYYTCQEDALTQSSRADCKNHLPERLRPFLENRG